MTFSATVFNIDFTGSQSADVNDNLGNAHIHAGVPATPGQNLPVVWGFIGAPFNDNNPNDVVVTPFASGVGYLRKMLDVVLFPEIWKLRTDL